MPELLTHSRLSCFRACPRKHYLRYERKLRPVETSEALRVGSAFHYALECDAKGLDAGVGIDERLENAYDRAIVAAMYSAHKTRWADYSIEIVATEQPFRIPLVNPDTGAPTPIWDLAGVLDKIVRLADGRLALMEYKTTSLDFTPGADYWTRLHLDPQLSIYVIAARKLGHDIQTVLYDVTRRPSLRPLKATPEDKRKYKADGTLYANQRAIDETPEEFAARVSAAIAEDPSKYFARIEIARLDQDLEDCAGEIWQQQQSIREAQRTNRWYKNPSSCFDFGRSCEYLPICSGCGLNGGIPPGFTQVDNVHPELNREARAGQAAQVQE
jgi:hypothetical protein